MNDPKPGLIERTLCRLLEYQDIRDDDTGELYLRRFFLWRNNTDAKNKSHSRVYLHKFVRSDKDRCLHDHPFNYVSLILKGGYWEETVPSMGYKDWRLRTWYRPGRILKRPATWTHRVILPEAKFAWTLVLTSGKKRDWGFHLESGWCYWRNYVKGLCICGSDGEDKRLTT